LASSPDWREDPGTVRSPRPSFGIRHAHLLHDGIDVRGRHVVEVSVPRAATADGRLKLTWIGSDADKGVRVAGLVLTRAGE
jgi:hypothetical protein